MPLIPPTLPDIEDSPFYTLLTEGPDSHAMSGVGPLEGLKALGGDDTIDASTFSEGVMDLGGGNDILTGHPASAFVLGGAGNDTIEAGAHSDVHGGNGDDVIRVNRNLDSWSGGSEEPWIMGGDGNDTIVAALRDLNFSGKRAATGYTVSNNAVISGGEGLDTFQIPNTLAELEFIEGPDGVLLVRTENSGDVRVIGIEEFALEDQVISIDDIDVQEMVVGTSGDDTLSGTDATEFVLGLGGDDLIIGGNGADTLDGGDGNDTLSFADADGPVLLRDPIAPGADRYFAKDFDGPDGQSLDVVGFENFVGTAFDDVIHGTDVDNELTGLAGDDVFYGTEGADHFDGGAGTDTVTYFWGRGISASLLDGVGTAGIADGDTFDGIENLTGTQGNDVLIGDDGDNVLTGERGSVHYDVSGGGWDTLTGNGGDDTLVGGFASNWYSGSTPTNDVAVYNGARDDYTLSGTVPEMTVADGNLDRDGTDTLYQIGSLVFSDGIMVLAASRWDSLGMATTDDDETIFGSALYVQDFMLYGRGGDDLFLPGLYAKSFHGGLGTDRVDFSGYTTAIEVDLSTRSGTGDGTLTFVAIEDIDGSGYGDLLRGDDEDNRFFGNRGSDTVEGGGGTDTAVFGLASTDAAFSLDRGGLVVTSAEGADLVMPDVETLVFMDGTLRFQQAVAVAGPGPEIGGSEVRDVMEGTFMNEWIGGLGGSDWITPGRGNDTVHGGASEDMVSYSDVADIEGRGANFLLDIDLGRGTAAVFGGEVDQLVSVERATGTVFADVLRGSDGDDDLRGLGDYDWFIATEGQDTLDGGNGLDMLSFVEWGGSGTDALLDVFSTDGAPPAAVVANGITLDLAAPSAGTGLAAGLTLTSIERVTGSSYQDVFHGDGGENDFRGLGGYDWFVSSTGGRERYFGGRGSDTVTYFNASSGIAANLSNGAMVDGEETGFGSAGDARLDLYFGIENLVGTAFDDSLSGSNERNQLNGLEGDDIIFGHGGVDYLKGGDGNDTIDGGDGSDFALFDGEMADYTLSRHAANEVTVDHASGTDHLIDVEYLRFDDQQISLWSLPIG